MEEEQWKPVVGFESTHQVSSMGRISLLSAEHYRKIRFLVVINGNTKPKVYDALGRDQ
jgi:hypothetical protein